MNIAKVAYCLSFMVCSPFVSSLFVAGLDLPPVFHLPPAPADPGFQRPTPEILGLPPKAIADLRPPTSDFWNLPPSAAGLLTSDIRLPIAGETPARPRPNSAEARLGIRHSAARA